MSVRRLRTADVSSEWDFMVVKSIDQGVTNSAVLTSDNELKWSMKDGDLWRVQLYIIYTADVTGDFKMDFVASTGDLLATWRAMGEGTGNAFVFTGDRDGNVTSTSDTGWGGGSTTVLRRIWIEAWFRAGTDQDITFRFAQNVQTAGQTATCKAGSTLWCKRLGNLT